ncbi:aspartyl protease family protein [Roseateles sp.]|uniref:aspartyl protease family protein n=1 Tax=Roseateles sp. TaxID=1971397 RepID=UPI0039E74422
MSVRSTLLSGPAGKWRALLAAAALLLAGPAQAEPASLQQALATNDVERLEQLAKAGGPQANVAQAVALSLRHRDAQAQPALERAAVAATAPQDRAAALQELAALSTRQGRYMAAAQALDASARVKPLDQAGEQALGFLRALAAVPPMRMEAAPRARLPVTRDAARLVRVDGSVAERPQDFVVDTGAAFSTMTVSAAKRLGLQMLDTEASVGSVSRDAVATRFAVAQDLRLDGAVLHDVVFIVLPDAALSFAGGAYRIDAILGLPVFLQLGRLAIEVDDGREQLTLGSAAPTTTGPSNLILSGVQPLLLAHSEAAGQTLRLFVDTGAGSSQLFRNAVDEAPQLLKGAVSRPHTLSGAGGSSTDEEARVLPRLDLRLGEGTVELREVVLLSKAATDRHGAVGQDLLRQGRGYVMDFERMCLSLLR